MGTDRWSRVKALFQAALARPAEARAAFLARECTDAELRGEVLRLLASHDQATDFLDSPVGATAGPASADPLIGRRLGDFVLRRRIGAGGMGVVYEAEQAQPSRLVAVKVLRPGLASASLLRRFEFEAEVLARLGHPNIARVYAAGTFDLGDGPQPWFAMERIQGVALHDYARSARPGQRARLELLIAIADAVQYAHQQGVIHRDLKPANILVETLAPTAPGSPLVIPRILDFGVARVVGADALTQQTRVDELVGTLNYMSPEQLSAGAAVDSRSDVYALGVIGFELLAGELPYRRHSTFVDAIRAIERDEPRRLGAVGATLRGDLETIFAKALEKEPARRYPSSAELAEDLRRFLANEPIRARPATALYRFRKFVRRNRALVGGVAATILALVAGLLLYANEAARAHQEAARARYEAHKATAINNFMTNDFLMRLLAAAGDNPDERLPVADLVSHAASQIPAMFAADPLAEAAVRNEVATVHYNLGTLDRAAAEFEQALRLWEQQLGPDHPDTLKAVNNLGQTLMRLRRPADAEPLYRRALDARRRVLGPDDPFTLVSMNNLAELLRGTDRLDEAEALLRTALAAQLRVQGPMHKDTLTSMANLGSLLAGRGQTDEALRLHQKVYETSRATFGADHVMTLQSGSRYGQTLCAAGQGAPAAALMREIVAATVRLFGPARHETISARRVLARAYRLQGQTAAAAEELGSALAAAQALNPPAESLARAIERELAGLAPSRPTTAGKP